MTPTPTQGGWTYPPPCIALQEVATVGIPLVTVEDPPHRERWMCLVELVQHMWRMGEIPQELRWTVLVLIPKGTANTRCIVLLDTLWKVV